ncbi:hypothetical protein quinque_009322 [Culex quinquefasciatus]
MKSLVAFALCAQFLYCAQCFVIPPPGAFGGHPVIPQQYHHYTRPVVYQISYYYNYYGGDQSGATSSQTNLPVTVLLDLLRIFPRCLDLLTRPTCAPPDSLPILKGKCKERF